MAILDQMKPSSTMSMLMVAAALVILFGHHRAAAQQNCPQTTADQARNITVYCVLAAFRLPTEESSSQPTPIAPCCDAARAFNFSCSCSSPVLNNPRVPRLLTVRSLTAAARTCNITLPQGLDCLGVRT